MEIKDKYYVDWKLLASFLSGNATETEKSQVQAWLDRSDKNKETFRNVEKLWSMTKNAGLANIDIETAWKNVNSRSHIIPESRTIIMFYKSYKYALRVAAVLVIGLLSWFIINNFNYRKTANAGSSLLQLTLNDGSLVTLNKNAQLKYPNIFQGNTREVLLKGEAFFNVARNPQKPFIINTSKTQIRVLGTSFNVSTDAGGDVEIIVKSGIVAFEAENTKQKVVLYKDDKAVFNAKMSEIKKSVNTDPNYLSWKTRKFIFRETRLEDVFGQIEKVYGVHVKVKDTIINHCRLTATYDKLEAKEIMKMIELTFRFKTNKNNDVYTIEGNDCRKR